MARVVAVHAADREAGPGANHISTRVNPGGLLACYVLDRRAERGCCEPKREGSGRTRPRMTFLRERFWALTFLAITNLFATQAAWSEVGGVHVDVTPYGGYADWAKEINFENKPFFGGKLGI